MGYGVQIKDDKFMLESMCRRLDALVVSGVNVGFEMPLKIGVVTPLGLLNSGLRSEKSSPLGRRRITTPRRWENAVLRKTKKLI